MKDSNTMLRFLDVIKAKDNNFTWLTIIDDVSKKEQSYTFGDLQKEINRFICYFEEQQVKPGDIVLIIERESLQLFASFFAGIIYGAIPAFYAYPSPKQSREQFLESITHLVEYNKIRIIFTFSEIKDLLSSFDFHESFLGIHTMSFVCNNTRDRLLHLLPRDEFFLQFSSGTTGGKKGVKLSTSALFNQVNAYQKVIDFDSKSVVVSWLPHYHDMGLIACMLAPFIKNVPLVMMSPFHWVKRPQMLLEAIHRFRGTHVWLPNFALGHMVNNCTLEDMDLSCVRKITCCSEPVLYESVKKFIQYFASAKLADDVICNCYAMAENTFAMTNSLKLNVLCVDYTILKNEHRVQQQKEGYPLVSAGTPLENIEIIIIGEDKQHLAQDLIGEIHIKSNCMLSEYHNNPKATNAAFHQTWFNTGDLGFIHEGELYITGRKKELIIVGGENIYPQDIEQILNDRQFFIPGRNVVFGIEDKRVGTEKIIAIAEIDASKINDIDVNDIKTIIFNTLNISVAQLLLLPKKTLKKSTAGKISRHLNKIKYLNGDFDNVFLQPQQQSSESRLENIIRNNLLDPNARFYKNTDLFASGLIDSFSFVNLIKDLEVHFDKQIPQDMLRFELFKDINTIYRTFCGELQSYSLSEEVIQEREQSLDKLGVPGKDRIPWREWLLNHLPFPTTRFYIWGLRLLGISIGKDVVIQGRISFKVRGKPGNIIMDDHVRISKNVDLRNRENGVIHLHKKAYIDSNVRIVAARDGHVIFHEGASIGANSIINSGGLITIGKHSMIASNVNMNSSSHGTKIDSFIKTQPYTHGTIAIGDDVWIGSGVSVLPNTYIGNGTIISSNSLISGKTPEYALMAGVPAKFIKYR